MAKRAAGEGTWTKLPNGTWEGKITVGTTPDGRPIRPKRRARTQAELKARLAEAKKQYSKATSTTSTTLSKRPTVSEWMHYWIEEIRAEDLEVSPRTLGEYRGDLRRYIAPNIGDILLTKLDEAAIEKMFRTMIRNGRRPATVWHAQRTLSAALNEAVRKGKMSRNPARKKVKRHDDVGVTLPRDTDEHKISPLTTEESLAVLDAALAWRNPARWRIALSLGCRQGESLGLRLTDIDWTTKILTVRRQVQRITWQHGCEDEEQCFHPRTGKKARPCDCPQRIGPGGLVIRPTKGKRSRDIALSPAMLDELRGQLAQLEADKKAAGDARHEEGWLFPNEYGRLTDPRDDYDQWVRLLDQSGVRRRRLHDARHTAASSLLDLGLDESAVMQVFGWSDRSLLEKYQHRQRPHLIAIADAMEKALPGRPHRNGLRAV